MAIRTLAIIVVSLSALVACERSGDSQSAPTPATEPTASAESTTSAAPAPAKAQASFVNKVWVVTESKKVAPGEFRIGVSLKPEFQAGLANTRFRASSIRRCRAASTGFADSRRVFQLASSSRRYPPGRFCAARSCHRDGRGVRLQRTGRRLSFAARAPARGARARQPFESSEAARGLSRRPSTHLRRWGETRTHARPLRLSKQQAGITGRELHATRKGGLAVRHAGNGRGNAGHDAASPATGPAIHQCPLWKSKSRRARRRRRGRVAAALAEPGSRQNQAACCIKDSSASPASTCRSSSSNPPFRSAVSWQPMHSAAHGIAAKRLGLISSSQCRHVPYSPPRRRASESSISRNNRELRLMSATASSRFTLFCIWSSSSETRSMRISSIWRRAAINSSRFTRRVFSTVAACVLFISLTKMHLAGQMFHGCRKFMNGKAYPSEGMPCVPCLFVTSDVAIWIDVWRAAAPRRGPGPWFRAGKTRPSPCRPTRRGRQGLRRREPGCGRLPFGGARRPG